MSEEEPKPKKSKAMLFGVIAALVLGGGGAFATYSGMVSLPFGGKTTNAHKSESAEKDDTAYVKLDPIVIDLGRGGRAGQLRVALIVETTSHNAAEVEDRKYRITDTLYSFLRAIRQDDLRDPARTDMLRSRILRRVLLETPPGAVSDVLISEFVVL